MNQLWRKGTLFQKIGLVYLIFTIVPLIVLGWIQYRVSSNIIAQNNSVMLNNILGKSKENLERVLKEVNTTYLNVIDSDAIAHLLKGSPANRVEETLFISEMLQKLQGIQTTEDIAMVNWYPLDQEDYPEYKHWATSRNYIEKDWYYNAALRAGKPLWESETYSNHYRNEPLRLLTQYRLLRDKHTLQPLGFIGISLSVPVLNKQIQVSNELKGQRLLLVDERLRVLIDTHMSKQDSIDQELLEQLNGEDGSAIISYQKKHYFVTQATLEGNRWLVERYTRGDTDRSAYGASEYGYRVGDQLYYFRRNPGFVFDH